MSLPEGDEEALEVAVAAVGPIAVSVDVQEDLVSYHGGEGYFLIFSAGIENIIFSP